MKGLSWVMLENIGPSKSKGCGIRGQCGEAVTPSVAPVRFCICYRWRVRKGSHDRNDRKVQPRAR